MLNQNNSNLLQANQNPEHSLPADLTQDHYLLLLEVERWEKGRKVSKPQVRFYSITDFNNAVDDNFFSRQGFSVEILHDPTRDMSNPSIHQTTESKSSSVKKKEDYIKEYADLLEVDVDQIDSKMTIKELQAEIEAIKKENEK